MTTAATRLRGAPRALLVTLVRGYRLLLSPWLGSACRFEPTCSAYALQALQRHGARAGSALTAWRLLRCHPWCAGGCDPVPDKFSWRPSVLTRPEAPAQPASRPPKPGPAPFQQEPSP